MKRTCARLISAVASAKRGQPRATPLTPVNENEIPARRRGGPRKVPLTPVNENEKSNTPTVKSSKPARRKAGQPRKVPPTPVNENGKSEPTVESREPAQRKPSSPPLLSDLLKDLQGLSDREIFRRVVPKYPNYASALGLELKRRTANCRPDIISEQLCDDILRYIEKDLEQYKGCDILDINPGLGIWSTKIHEFLKPKKHVLLEPQWDIYENSLKSLIDQPDSKYTLSRLPVSESDTYSQIFSEHFPQHNAESSAARSANKNLLVIGNLTAELSRTDLEPNLLASRIQAYRFIQASIRQDFFHIHGSVRMLVWLTEEDKTTLLGREASHPNDNNRLSMASELLVNLTEIATSSLSPDTVTEGAREVYLQSALRTREHMRSTNTTIPTGRTDLSLENALGEYSASLENEQQGSVSRGRGYGWSRDDMAEWLESLNENKILPSFTEERKTRLMELRSQYMSGDVNVNIDPVTQRGDKFWTMVSKEWAATNFQSRRHKRKMDYLSLQKEVLSLERDVHFAVSTVEKHRTTKRWAEARERLQSLHKQSDVSHSHASEVILFYNEATPWYRRPFEPLLIHKAEVLNQRRISLLDISPRDPMPCTKEEHAMFLAICYALGPNMEHHIKEAVASIMGPVGGHGILEKCPSFTDPTKGGRLRLEDLHCRHLTPELVLELAKTWQDWPWRTPASFESDFFFTAESGFHRLYQTF